MNIQNPIWLWALLALFIPLLIHLINKGKTKAIPFGSLLWLPEKNTQPSQKIKFQDVWLWLVRSLLFVLIAGLIAHPFINQTIQQKNKRWLLIKDGVQEKIIQQIEDTISLNQWEVKRLSYGLETFDFNKTNSSSETAINPYAVLRLIETEKHKPLSLSVVGNFNATDLKGKAPDFSFPVEWVLLPNDYSNEHLAKIKRKNSTSYLITNETKHLTKIKEAQKHDTIDSSITTLNLQDQSSLIVYNEKFNSLQKGTAAALKALQRYHNISYNIKKTKDLSTNFENVDQLFWLSESAMPSINSITTIYSITKDLPNGTFVQLRQNVIEWNEPNHYNKLPYLLSDMMFKNEAIDKRFAQIDSRPVHASFYNYENVEYTIPIEYQKNEQRSLVYYCWVLLMVLLVLERYLNSR